MLLTDGQYLVGQTGVKVLLRDTQSGQYRTRLEAFQRGDVGGSLILRTVDETGPVNVQHVQSCQSNTSLDEQQEHHYNKNIITQFFQRQRTVFNNKRSCQSNRH